MDRRVAILRFWLLCFAAIVCAACWPSFGVGLWPVLFLFPSCVCCGAIPCTAVCDTGTTPIAITFVVTGIVNSTNCTTCDDLNATWVLDQLGGCTGQFNNFPFECVVLSPGAGATYTWTAGGGQARLSFSILADNDTYRFVNLALGATPFICNTLSDTLPFLSQTQGDDFCDASGGSVEASA